MKLGELLFESEWSRKSCEINLSFPDGVVSIVVYDLGDFYTSKKVEGHRISFYTGKPGEKNPFLEYEAYIKNVAFKRTDMQRFLRGLKKHFKNKTLEDVKNFGKAAENLTNGDEDGDGQLIAIVNKIKSEG